MTSKKKKKSSRSDAHCFLYFLHAIPLLPLLPSRRTSTTATDRRSRTRRRRKSSRHALCFLLWGCAVLCLAKPPPQHTPELTATEFAGAMRGAWKQTGASVSHDPKEAIYNTSGEDDWKSSKIAKNDSLSAYKTMSLHQGTPLLRSNTLPNSDNRQQELMLSFSSVKSEVPFLSKDGGLVDKATHNSFFPYFQRTPSAYSRNAAYGSGSLNSSMHGSFAGVSGPFTQSQWIELENQALIYKYITSNVAVPSNLLFPLKRSLYPYGLSGTISDTYLTSE